MIQMDCKVAMAGPSADGRIAIGLVTLDGQFEGFRVYFANPPMQREMLAVAIAALNGNHRVSAVVTSIDESQTIMVLHLESHLAW